MARQSMTSMVPQVRAGTAALAIVVAANLALLTPDLRAQDTTMAKVALYALTLEELLKI